MTYEYKEDPALASHQTDMAEIGARLRAIREALRDRPEVRIQDSMRHLAEAQKHLAKADILLTLFQGEGDQESLNDALCKAFNHRYRQVSK
jgi:hypothetical protein